MLFLACYNPKCVAHLVWMKCNKPKGSFSCYGFPCYFHLNIPVSQCTEKISCSFFLLHTSSAWDGLEVMDCEWIVKFLCLLWRQWKQVHILIMKTMFKNIQLIDELINLFTILFNYLLFILGCILS